MAKLSIEAHRVQVQCCFTFTETIRTIRHGEPSTATSTFTQLLDSTGPIPAVPHYTGICFHIIYRYLFPHYTNICFHIITVFITTLYRYLLLVCRTHSLKELLYLRKVYKNLLYLRIVYKELLYVRMVYNELLYVRMVYNELLYLRMVYNELLQLRIGYKELP